jgi:YVTN family beta-propeller protein
MPADNSPLGVAVAPDGRYVYVTNNGANTMSVIDTSTNAVVTAIPVGISPAGVAVTARNVYVAKQDLNDVSVIDI